MARILSFLKKSLYYLFFVTGINIFLDGFVPTENLRFRESSLVFKVAETADKVCDVEHFIQIVSIFIIAIDDWWSVSTHDNQEQTMTLICNRICRKYIQALKSDHLRD